ncbi:cytochrome C oxidase subunit IV family protein [Paenibacillus chibensis]|uniref:Cytochrome C oxidase subunit IV family protein n=1 Tax=Paenibacillus chibensis TaxID=59846 RepID=A0ABU6PP93_9BACL|nr:cytochrome C oxidase subunit IV family protein [Paenibacillus chibensis]MEC0373398.1 cytochrome C oxidase subunit IV family protein [Paenibacillus chibensis]MED5016204.1 cytochrome C oxidase subunit IV family protein [Paenibacillus chibensis]
MTSADHQATHDVVKHSERHEGPQKHIIVFVLSIVLTAIAFAAVAAGGVNAAFTVLLLLVMAVIQVLVQMGYWMHLKDRGHMMPIIFMLGGFFVAGTAIVTALYWVWW